MKHSPFTGSLRHTLAKCNNHFSRNRCDDDDAAVDRYDEQMTWTCAADNLMKTAAKRAACSCSSRRVHDRRRSDIEYVTPHSGIPTSGAAGRLTLTSPEKIKIS